MIAGPLQVLDADAAVAQQIGVELALRAPGQQVLGDRLPLRPSCRAAARAMSISERASPCGGATRAREEHGRARRHEGDLLLLERRRLRQHDVGELRRRRHGMGGDRHEVERAQRLHGAARVGIGDEDVDAAGIERAHGIGLAGQHGLDHGGVVAGRLPALGPGPQRKAVGADGALSRSRRRGGTPARAAARCSCVKPLGVRRRRLPPGRSTLPLMATRQW